MEPNWGGFYNYYPQDPNRSFDRNQPQSSSEPATSPHDEQGPKRGQMQSPFLPPPPPPGSQGGHPSMGLPPFSHSFYNSGYHPSQSPPQGAPNIGLASSFGSSASAPPYGAGYHGHPGPNVGSTSPNPPSGSMASLSRALPSNPRGMHSYSESPRLAPGPLNYSSSPGQHHLSPLSPTTHLIPPSVFSGPNSSNNSSVFPQTALRTPSSTKRKGRQPGSPSGSGDSWDGSDRSGKPVIGEETDERPWGMPQEQYKALNPRDKKQVRNRIGARRFRAKRKDYVSNIETSLRVRDDELSSLRAQVESYRAQVNDLRSRLGMPLLSPQLSNSSSTPGLGLLVSHSGSDGWVDGKDD